MTIHRMPLRNSLTVFAIAAPLILQVQCSNPAGAAAEPPLKTPVDVRISIVHDTTAQITFHGTNPEPHFKGYVLIDTSRRDNILDSIPFTSSYDGDTMFIVSVNPDKTTTFGVAARSSRRVHTPGTVTFLPRKHMSKVKVQRWVSAGSGGDGLNVDGDSISVVNVANIIRLNGYTDQSGADILFEKIPNSNALTITAINGSSVFAAPFTALLPYDTLLAAAKTARSGHIATIDNLCVYASGYSYRSSCEMNASVAPADKGSSFIVLSNDGSVARLVVDTMTIDSVRLDIYKDSPVEGSLLY